MKHSNTVQEFDDYPLINQLFYLLWLEKRRYPIRKELLLSQWKELAEGLGLVVHDTSIERVRSDGQSMFFENVIDLGEVLIAWDGELVDTLSYHVNERLEKRLAR